MSSISCRPPFGGVTDKLYFFSDLGDMPLGLYQNYLTATGQGAAPEARALDGLTLLSLTANGILAYGSYKQVKTARKTDDVKSELFAELGLIRYVAKVASNAMTLIKDIYRPIQTGRLYGPLKTGLSYFSSAIQIAKNAIKLSDAASFATDFKKARREGKGLEFLKEHFYLTAEDKREAINKVLSQDPEHWQGFEPEKGPEVGEVKACVHKICMDLIKGHRFKEFTVIQQNEMPVMGAILNEFENASKRKLAQLGRDIGTDAMVKVKKELPHLSEEAKAEDLMQSVKVGNAISITLKATIMSLAAVSAILVTASFFVSGGAGLLALGILGMLTGLVGAAIDGYFLYMAMKHEAEGRYENLILFLASFLMMGMVTAGIVLASTPASFVLFATVGLLWVSLILTLIAYRYFKKS